MYCSLDPQVRNSTKFLLKLCLTILFTHLKIILLQYFQFSTINNIQTYPKSHFLPIRPNWADNKTMGSTEKTSSNLIYFLFSCTTKQRKGHAFLHFPFPPSKSTLAGPYMHQPMIYLGVG